MIRSKSMIKTNGSVAAAAIPTGAPVLKRSFTVDLASKKPQPLIEFPVSPQLILGEEMIHFGHPQHPVAKIDLPDVFTCSGCKESGSGKRFVCQQCDFQLHEFCALAATVLKNHPFHYHHQLLFHSKPAKGGIMKSKCDFCGKPTKGYTFRCRECGFQLHPCCAMLSMEISFSGHPQHRLILLPTTATSSSPPLNGGGDDRPPGGFICGECRRKRSGRVYRCSQCEYYLHGVCAKDMVNGIQATGKKEREKRTAVGTAAKLASQVVLDLIGGIIEGIGEGVGEAIVQSVAKGGGDCATRAFPRQR